MDGALEFMSLFYTACLRASAAIIKISQKVTVTFIISGKVIVHEEC